MVNLKSEVNKIEGLYQIKIDVPFLVKFLCLYLFKVADKNVLIDAGLNLGTWKKSLLAAFNKIDLSLHDIDYCIISHIHIDHISMVKILKQENPEIKILMHDITHDLLKWETTDTNLKEYEQEAKNLAKKLIKHGISEEQGKTVVQFLKHWPKYLHYQKPDILVYDRDILFDNLEVIWTQ